jgi:membrane-anchored glycerophosphoryl diester phosphodiesterase (GDPDase)
MDDEQKVEDIRKSEDNSVKKLINVAVIIMLVALIFIALFSFFFNMQEAISRLFDNRYVALMNAVFNIVVIGIAVYLVKMFLAKK